MDVVYNCRDGENEELRYSIRSVYNNLNYENLWVVGGKPDWYLGHYQDQEYASRKEVRERLGFKAMIDNDTISDDFILMNDDFYVLHQIDKVVNWNGGLLADKVNLYNSVSPSYYYSILLRKTHAYLVSQGIKDPLDFEMHTPMVMNKQSLSKIIDQPLLTRSLYGNLFNVESEQHKDVKVYPPGIFQHRSISLNEDTPYISSMDETFKRVFENVLIDRFDTRSPYER